MENFEAGVLDQVTKVIDLGHGYYNVHVCNVHSFIEGKAYLCRDAFRDDLGSWVADNHNIEILNVVLPQKYKTYFLAWKIGCNWTEGYLIVKSPSKPLVGNYIMAGSTERSAELEVELEAAKDYYERTGNPMHTLGSVEQKNIIEAWKETDENDKTK